MSDMLFGWDEALWCAGESVPEDERKSYDFGRCNHNISAISLHIDSSSNSGMLLFSEYIRYHTASTDLR